MSEPQGNSKKTKPNRGGDGDDVVTIKKYANRRLYNTATSAYVTLDYLAEMVKNGQDFVVYDAKSGQDITHSVLTQIIFEEESKGQNLLPIQFLRQLIKFYGDNLQSFVPSYLEMSMDAFTLNQDKFRNEMRGALAATPGFSMFEETTRQNMALFEQAMKMFTPMGGLYAQNGKRPASEPEESDAVELSELKAELADLKKQLSQIKNT